MKKIAVILPAYNEELTIEKTITSFGQFLPEASIWVVDNNSKDNTNQLAKATLSREKIKGGVIEELRQGKSNAVRRAFLTIDADIYVLCDADMTYPADEVRKLIHPVEKNQADMVVGDRISNGDYLSENKRNFHNFGNILVKKLINRLFKAKLNDILSGYRVFSNSFVKNYPILIEGFELETDVTIYALDKKFRILEVPIQYKDRPPGSFSKLSTFSDGYKVLGTIWKIFRYTKPLTFFISFSIFFLVLGLLTSTPVIEEFIKSGEIKHVPLAILSTGLEIFSIILFSVGLTLDSIKYHADYSFHIALNKDT